MLFLRQILFFKLFFQPPTTLCTIIKAFSVQEVLTKTCCLMSALVSSALGHHPCVLAKHASVLLSPQWFSEGLRPPW